MRTLLAIPLALVVLFTLVPTPVYAGTTGGLSGRVLDSQTRAPVSGVTVTATAPSQTATATSDAAGAFRFLSLAPDTYTLNFSKSGYDSIAQPGFTVFADQVQTYIATMVRTLRTIAHVTAQASASLVKPGRPATSIRSTRPVSAPHGLSGPGSLNNAYGAIARSRAS